MKNIQHIRLFEYLLYASILLVALYDPFLNSVFEHHRWGEVSRTGVRILPFLLVFLINNYLLVPRLLFTEKYLYYFLSCILSVIVAVFLSDILLSLQPLFNRMPPPDLPFPQGKMPPHDSFLFPRKGMPPPPGGFFHPMRHPPFHNFGQVIIAFLVIGFNSGVKSFVRWSEERVKQAERESQHLHTELAFLKHQISPHFFMNTLNNIHSLVDVDTEKARDAIVKLSRMMRYLLYESDDQKVSLKKEIEFIESYIELMRLRYDEDMLTIETEYPAFTEEIFVPSFLFLSFIENAFKHGVGLYAKSLIRIRFVFGKGRLTFAVSNSKSGIAPAISETSGIGLENVRKRLNLIYKDDYTLDIRSGDDTYEINLNIPV